jgi:hypothetical protein
MEPRRARMRGVRAPHRRTAHTAHPPIRGCAAGCAVGGANPAPPAHRWSPSAGEGVVRRQRRAATAPQDRTILPTCWPAVTLSNENALSRSWACPDPPPPACGPEWATHGPPLGHQGRVDGLMLDRHASAGVPHRRPPQAISAGWNPSWGQSAAESAADWPPYGGVERARRLVCFARLIQRRVRVLGRTFGPRHLRRPSQPGLVTTERDAEWAARMVDRLPSGPAPSRSGTRFRRSRPRYSQ